MQKVHLAPLWSVVVGAVGLAAIGWFSALSVAGWCAGLLYLVVSNALLTRGLRRRGTSRFGPANAATAVRSTLVGLITALVATSFTDADLGAAAHRTDRPGARTGCRRRLDRASHATPRANWARRFDMEVDAFLLLVLSAYVAQDLGWWVLTIGLLRYAFVAAGWVLPWMTATLPPRYWRKVVTAAAGIALTIAASGLMPRWVDVIVTLVALGLLIESFGRDVIWLIRLRQREGEARVSRSSGA